MAIKPSILSNSYVKFVRTNSTLWKNLTSKDPDTLYFIIENDSDNGQLYLGDVLIASSIPTSFSIEDLDNVILTSVRDGQVLVSSGSEWVNRDLSDFMPVTMVGAKPEEDGEAGLVPMPAAGQQNLYLQGNGTWSNPTATLEASVGKLDERVDDLDNRVSTIEGTDIGKTMRAVAGEVVAQVVDGAPETFDTLKEIAAWIAGEDGKVAMDAEALISEVGSLKTSVFGDGTENNLGLVSRVGTLEQITSDLKDGLEALEEVVGDVTHGLVKTVNNNTTNIEANTSEIAQLWNALKWNELVEATV